MCANSMAKKNIRIFLWIQVFFGSQKRRTPEVVGSTPGPLQRQHRIRSSRQPDSVLSSHVLGILGENPVDVGLLARVFTGTTGTSRRVRGTRATRTPELAQRGVVARNPNERTDPVVEHGSDGHGRFRQNGERPPKRPLLVRLLAAPASDRRRLQRLLVS